MKRQLIQLLLATTVTGVLTTGCVHSHRMAARQPAPVLYPTSTVIVKEAPPAPRHEVVGTAPDASQVWVAGYWTYTNNRWTWVPGHWEARPRQGAVWVPGQWDKDPNERGWVWTPGHWE